MLTFDGSQGEGGGQVLRTCLALSTLLGKSFRLTNIRANRSKPGLRPQHLACVLAASEICKANTIGAQLGSRELFFEPQSKPLTGQYQFDIAKMAQTPSAGSVTLLLQAIIWPLLFSNASSHLDLIGGTHVPFSPPWHYTANVLFPALAGMDASIDTNLKEWGWMPAGGGRITVDINPSSQIRAVTIIKRDVIQVNGLAAVTNLPSHIPNRMAKQATKLLSDVGINSVIRPQRARSKAAGAGIFLWLQAAGFSSLGRRGLPAEKVASAAVADLLSFIENNAGVDKHLADQLLLPMALAKGKSTFTTDSLTNHTLGNAKLLRRWLEVPIKIEGDLNQPATVKIDGTGYQSN